MSASLRCSVIARSSAWVRDQRPRQARVPGPAARRPVDSLDHVLTVHPQAELRRHAGPAPPSILREERESKQRNSDEDELSHGSSSCNDGRKYIHKARESKRARPHKAVDMAPDPRRLLLPLFGGGLAA
mgnify:CR=1 FL=1